MWSRDQKLTITLSTRQVIIPFAGATERYYGNFGEGIAREILTKLREVQKEDTLCKLLNQFYVMASYNPTDDADVTMIEQWVHKMTNYSTDKWSEERRIVYSRKKGQMCGSPDNYPAYGDNSYAWSPKTIDENQFVQVQFKEKVFVTKIYIYETYHAGAVKAIKALDKLGDWQTLYSTYTVTSISQSRIFSPELRDLDCKTNELRIEVDCTASGSHIGLDAVKLHGKRYRTAPPSSIELLVDDLRNLMHDQQISDVEFDVENKIVYGHKSIICSRSNYFRDMITRNTKDGRTAVIKLPDVTHDIFKAVLSYIYTDRLSVSCNVTELTDIWRAADRLSIERLKVLTEIKISEKINDKNVVDVYLLASSKPPVIEEITTKCRSYMSIMCNMAKIVNQPSFMSLPKETILEIFQATMAKK